MSRSPRFECRISSRTSESESVIEKHRRLIECLRSIPSPWGIQENVKNPDFGSGLIAAVSLSKHFGQGVTGRVLYAYRHKGLDTRDLAMDDDWLEYVFWPHKQDWKPFVTSFLPRIILAFNAYRAECDYDPFDFHDTHEFVSAPPEDKGDHRDARHFVFRIPNVAFFDAKLCGTAFALSPSDVVARLSSHVERAVELGDGVYIVGTTSVLSVEEAETQRVRLTRLLKSS